MIEPVLHQGGKDSVRDQEPGNALRSARMRGGRSALAIENPLRAAAFRLTRSRPNSLFPSSRLCRNMALPAALHSRSAGLAPWDQLGDRDLGSDDGTMGIAKSSQVVVQEFQQW
jgi:hypothetical protein